MPIILPSPTRVRLFVGAAITAGALAPSLYSVLPEDATGSSVSILFAFAVEGSPDAVELVLDEPMTDGAGYEVSWSGVDSDAGLLAGAERVRAGQPTGRREATPQRAPIEPLLYGSDLEWNGDFVEGPDGDLSTGTGVANVVSASERSTMSNGLVWNPAYGAHLREFVDSPEVGSHTVRSRILADVLRDDRVVRAEVGLPRVSDDTASFPVTVWPRANPEAAQTFNVPIRLS